MRGMERTERSKWLKGKREREGERREVGEGGWRVDAATVRLKP